MTQDQGNPVQDNVNMALPWSQAWGECFGVYLWWLGLGLWGRARHSPKRRYGPVVLLAHNLQEAGVMCASQQPRTMVDQSPIH